ncbi:molybdopterin-binding oxidoreductase [Nocardia sp. NPDC059240]|uniref:molybdopterin-binding oxidoreductase n=1 Tax=Nocardia sp. NPDC059240 TaxID=3346786 RepID=UPI0036BE91F8
MTNARRLAVAVIAGLSIAAVPACSSTDGSAPTSTPQATTSTAAQPAPAGGLTITGAVQNPLTLTADRLRGYPVQTQAVTFDSSQGKQSHEYQGARLTDLIADAHPLTDKTAKNPELRLAVLATGSDGYQAVLSWAEFSPDFAAKPILVSYTEDSKPSPSLRLVVPGDAKGGRYVDNLVNLRVVDLGTAQPK